MNKNQYLVIFNLNVARGVFLVSKQLCDKTHSNINIQCHGIWDPRVEQDRQSSWYMFGRGVGRVGKIRWKEILPDLNYRGRGGIVIILPFVILRYWHHEYIYVLGGFALLTIDESHWLKRAPYKWVQWYFKAFRVFISPLFSKRYHGEKFYNTQLLDYSQ